MECIVKSISGREGEPQVIQLVPAHILSQEIRSISITTDYVNLQRALEPVGKHVEVTIRFDVVDN
jgi:hypothetical protein